MSLSPAVLAERLEEEGHKTVAFFEGLTPEQLRLRIYTEGSGWCVDQILAHFVAAEQGFVLLVEDIQAGGAGSPEDFDIDAYNERTVAALSGGALDDLLAQFRHIRQRSVTLVAGLLPADLERRGRHPFLGEASLADIVKLIYRHNQIHLRDVRKAFA